MHNIPIYKDELSVDGLEDKINQQASVAYFVPLEPSTNNITTEIIKSVAKLGSDNVIVKALNTQAAQTDSDLYFTKSILVTTTWNKNDDVFHPTHTWVARHTPSHKPTNLEHDENKLVGHIVDSWAIDSDGTLISDNTPVDELPQKYHLVTGSVIYKNWEGEDLQERTESLINQIEGGEKFVSMEVLFTDFDYAIQSSDGTFSVKPRDESTAFLTKHLRAYGGTGTYQDFKVGRLLKNMTFCGKGYVDKPANPESVIFSANTNFNFSTASEKLSLLDKNGVELLEENDSQINKRYGEANMAEDIYKEQATKLEKVVAELEAKLAETNDKLAKADVEKYTSQIEELTQAVDAQKDSITDLTSRLEDSETKLTEATEAVKTEKEAKAELETKLDELKVAEVKANRISTLVDGGMDKETATTKVEVFADLSDEQFSVVATDLIGAIKAQATTETEEASEETETEDQAEEEQEESEASTDEEVLENAETDDQVDMTVASEDKEDIADLRKELQEAIAERLGHSLDNNEGDE
jgi:hypothetical protein